MLEEKDNLRKEFLIKKDPGLDLGNSQMVHIARDAKISIFTVMKACSGEKAKGMAGESFVSAQEIKHEQRDHSWGTGTI